MATREILDRRRTNPLYRARTYIDRRIGAPDPARTQFQQREMVRQSRTRVGAPVQEVTSVPTEANGLEAGRLYRLNGSPTRLFITGLNSSGTLVVGEITLTI